MALKTFPPDRSKSVPARRLFIHSDDSVFGGECVAFLAGGAIALRKQLHRLAISLLKLKRIKNWPVEWCINNKRNTNCRCGFYRILLVFWVKVWQQIFLIFIASQLARNWAYKDQEKCIHCIISTVLSHSPCTWSVSIGWRSVIPLGGKPKDADT